MAYSKERTEKNRKYFAQATQAAGQPVDIGEIDAVDGGEIDGPIAGGPLPGLSPADAEAHLSTLGFQDNPEEMKNDRLMRDAMEGRISETDYYRQLGIVPPRTVTGGKDLADKIKPPVREIAASRTESDGTVTNFDAKGNKITYDGEPRQVTEFQRDGRQPDGTYNQDDRQPTSMERDTPGAPVAPSQNGQPATAPTRAGAGPAGGAGVAASQNPWARIGVVQRGNKFFDIATGAELTADDVDIRIREDIGTASGPGDMLRRAGGGAVTGVVESPGDPRRNRLGYTAANMQSIKEAPFETANMIEEAGAEELAANRRVEAHLEQAAREESARQLQRQREEANRQASVKQGMLRLELMTDDAKKAELGGSSYLSRNPLSGIMFALSSIVGGAYSGATGRENPGMNAFENAIQRDLEIQKYNLAKKQTDIDNEKSLLGQMRTQFADQRDAEQATEIALRNLSADKLATIAEGIKNTKMKNDVLMMVHEIRNNAAAKSMELERSLWLANHAGIGGGVGAGAPAKSEEKALLVQLEDGRTVEARSPGDAEKARNQQSAVRQLERLAREISAVRDDKWTYLPASERNATAKRLAGQWKSAVKNAEQWGALDKGVSDLSDETFGDFTSPFSRAGQRTMEWAREARNKYDDTIKSFGGEVVNRVFAADPKTGQPKPAVQYTGNREDPKPRMPTSVKPK